MNLQISSWAIRNPIPVVVAFAIATVAGLIAYFELPIKQFPNVAFPVVAVTVVQDGAAPTEMENQVTRLVENAISGIPSVESISSDVSLGVSQTLVQFNIGTPIEKVKDEVRSKIDQIRIELPAGIEPPRVDALDFTGLPIVTYAVSAPSMSPTGLSWFIDDTLARALQTVPGVGQVSRIGGVNREINVTLDPVRMGALGVTAAQINDALRQNFRNYGGGRAEVGGAESTVRVLNETATIEELRNLTIPLRTGAYVRLTDVADIGDGAGEERGFARLDGRPVVGFQVIKVDEASEVQVDDGVKEALDRLLAANPGVSVTKIVSIVDDTRANYEATVHVLLEGMALAALVVFFFLRDWRSTAIAATAMPLSLIPTFFVIGMMGFSLNVVTLLGLTLVIGILVDDAIVEIENIQKRTQAGATPFRAAMEGADAIGLAVVATTAAIAVVFLPVSFIKGISGQFFKEFGITVAVAVVFSLLVARLVTPLMAAYFLKPAAALHDARRLPRVYERSLTWCVDHPWLASLLGALSFFGAIAIGSMVPAGFIPTEDPGYVDFSLDGPPGSTRASMQRASDELTNILRAEPDVEHVFIVVGSSGANGDLSSGRATAVLREDRKLSTDEIRQKVQPSLFRIPDIRVASSEAGPGGGSTDVDVILSSENVEALQKAQLSLLQDLRATPEISNPRLYPAPPGPELIIRPRPDEAARLNVSADAIAAVARIATTGDIEANSAKFSEGKRRLPIRVRLPEEVRTDLRVLENLRVPTRDGGMTTLGAVADIGFAPGPGKIQRFDRERRASVQADFAPGVAAGAATAAINATPTIRNLPPDVKRASIGQERAMGELFGGILFAMLAGVAFIYCVLVLLFRSIFKPVVILSALPLSFSGAVTALFVTQLDVTMPVLIGMLMLLGLAAKNSILLVEFAIEAEREGHSARDALIAACRERARPIVMTTVAMSAGMLPTALGIGEGADFRQPMAVAVIGGLISSTLLSLVLVPAVYKIVDDFERWLNPKAARLTTPRTPEDDELLRSGEL
jgi:HAE1 family hydrophobic/amphiphilic exporter-1